MSETNSQQTPTPTASPVTPRKRGNATALWGVLAVLVGVAAVALAYQSLRSDMNAQFAATQKDLESIRNELRDLRQALDASDDDADQDAAPQQAAMVRLNVNGYPAIGNPKATLVMVEFTDFQCPYCARYHNTTYPILKKAYIDTQRMKYVAVDMPLDFHELAFKAAEAAHCGDQQGQYWPMFERLFKAAPRIDPPNLIKLAGEMGLNATSFKDCLDSGAMEAKVKRGISQAAQLSIDGTPTFVIGRAEGGVVRGRMVVGAYPTQVFDDLIKAHLALK